MDVLITGANSGIGYEAAKVLLQKGYCVHIVCRDEAKTNETVASLQGFGNVKKAGQSLDLSDLDSVRNFAEVQFTHPQLNVLICNAGVMGVPTLKTTKQGVEMHTGVNYLGHYVLTRLLLNKLVLGSVQSQTRSRVVNVSSLAYSWSNGTEIDFNRAFFGVAASQDDDEEYSFQTQYSLSKLFQLYDSKTMNIQHGTHILAMALHPGVIRTNLTRDMDKEMTEAILGDPSITKTVSQGAETTVFCASAPIEKLEVDDEPGIFYFENAKRIKRVSRLAQNDLRRLELETWTQRVLNGVPHNAKL